MKKLITLIVCICMVFSSTLYINAYASSQCGENVAWDITDGILTISGSGAMYDYNSEADIPWADQRNSIVKIIVESGITHIGDMAFYGCTNAETAEIADTVESVGLSAFSYTEGSKTSISNIDAAYGFSITSDVNQAKKGDEFYLTITLKGDLKNLSVLQSLIVFDKERISYDDDDWCDKEWYESVGENDLGYISEPLHGMVTNTVRAAYISLDGQKIDEGSPLYTAGETSVTVAKVKFKALKDIASIDVSCFSLKDCAIAIKEGNKSTAPECSVTQLTSSTVLPLSGISITTSSSAAAEYVKENGIGKAPDLSVKDESKPTEGEAALPKADTPDEITVYIDGEKVDFDVKPILYNDSRTMVPLRAIFEKLGAAVTWDDETQTAMAVKGNTFICCQINNTLMPTSNGNVTLDVPAMLINDRTLVPLRAISESFKYKVDWIDETQQVIITTQNIDE